MNYSSKDNHCRWLNSRHKISQAPNQPQKTIPLPRYFQIFDMRFFLFCLFAISVLVVRGQSVSGVIRSSEGDSIPHVHIHVRALNQNTTANSEGRFQMKLPDGIWVLEFRSIGFATLERPVQIDGKDIDIEIVLHPRHYMLGEVKVMSSGEDPGMYIMRRAIAMAPYYKNQISEYSSRVYLKGTGKFNAIPKILKKQIEKEGINIDDVFALESISEIEFKLPDQLKQNVIAQHSTGRGNNTSPMPMITADLYNAEEYGVISPLGRKALQVYTFWHIGVFEDQGRLVNRIRVIPKRKGTDVVDGIINITDGWWSIHSAELTVNSNMMDIDMKQLYAPVDEDVWMPVSFGFDVTLNVMGVKLNYRYAASISDYRITLNPELDHSFIETQRTKLQEEIPPPADEIADSQKDDSAPEQNKRQAELQQLLQKEELTAGESRKLNRMLTKETAKSQPPKSLEVNLPQMESATENHDSVFWNEVRKIPLTEAEIAGFRKKDSLVARQLLPEYRDSLAAKRTKFKLMHLITGKTYLYHSPNSKTRNTFTTPGILSDETILFNTVDGIRLNAPFIWLKRDTLGHQLYIKPEIGYAFARKKADAEIIVDYQKNKNRKVEIWGVITTSTPDFNQNSGMPVLLNDVYTLWFEQNYKKFFRRDGIAFGQQTEIVNGLFFRTNVAFSLRSPLENHSNYRFIDVKNRDYTANIPVNPSLEEEHLEKSRAATISVSLKWTPRQRYYYRNGFKYNLQSDWPTFTFTYKKAVSGIIESDAHFDFVEFGIGQKFGLNITGSLEYMVNAGKFFDTQSLHFSDFRHFRSDYKTLMVEQNLEGFRLLPYYRGATSNYFVQGALAADFERLLIKRLPIVNQTIMSERLYLQFLHTDKLRYYTELGYSLNNILAVFNVEAVAAFEAGKFSRAGIKLLINVK